MRSPYRQRGMSMPALVALLAVAGFVMLCAFKIVPLYAENRYIVSALKSLATTEQELVAMSNAQIRQKLNNFYMVNNVRSDAAQHLEIERSPRGVVVKVDYEARARLFDDAPLVGTMYVVVDFKNHLDSTRIRECCKPAQ
jgi:hypothetical protein